MNISGRKTREPTVRSIAMDRTRPDIHMESQYIRDRPTSHNFTYQQVTHSPPRRIDSSSGARVRILRLDADGREERRKVSNRENFIDTGLDSVRKSMPDEVYGYDSSAENTVHYLNESNPVPSKLCASPERKSQRTVDTIIPTVPRLNIPTNGHDVSFESKDSKDVEMRASSSPPSSRSEKLQRTLKNISLNEREPFPGVRARIARQRAREHHANSNNNAIIDDEGVVSPRIPMKPAHAEEDEVHVNSSPESVIVRPIKRKVATAPDVAAKSRVSVKKSASSAEPARSKSAEVKRSSSTAKWVDKTPGKGRSASASAQRAPKKQEVEQIRPDSWRKGMAIVRRELKHRKPADAHDRVHDSQPSSARSERSAQSSHSSGSRKSQASVSAEQVLRELRDKTHPDVRSPDRSTRPKRRVKVEKEVEPLPKQRHYDADSIREFMAKKKKEKRQQELEEKKRRLQEEMDRKQKLKLLQEHSRRKAVRPTASNATFTTIAAVAPPRAQPSAGVWAPAVDSTSYTVTNMESAKRKSPAEHSVVSEDSEGEGDTTLTEAELQAETPTKQHSRCSSKSSTPRKRDSPLMARTKAVEEEIEQLVQAAKQRNQSAQQIRAQGTPLKQIDQLGATDTTSTSSNRHTPPTAYQNAKSARIASLAHTTAQLMSKMSMLKADLENSAMSRSNSRVASNYDVGLNGSFSPREHVGYSVGHRSPYRAPLPLEEGSDSSETDDYNTHSSVSDSSKSHSTVTTDSDLSETESELSSLDLRIREALARPSNFTSSFSRPQAESPREVVKPVAKVSRTLTYEERGDGHSVVNTYLRKLQADRQALSVGGSKWTASTSHVTPTCTSVSTMTTQTRMSLSTTGIQTETTHTAFTSAGVTHKRAPDVHLPATPDTCSPSSVMPSAAVTVTAADGAALKLTSSRDHVASADVYGNGAAATCQSVFAPSTVSQSSATYTHASQSAVRQPTITQSNVQPPVSSQSAAGSRPTLLQPPPYAANTSASTQSHRISPAGLGLAFSAGLSLLEGVNQQHVQLSDVERTRFSTLAQQETVALAQILKGNKERQEQQMMNIRQKIKQDELEAERKLAQFKRDAELANQRRDEAEKQGEKEALKLSKEATRKVLEAQNESTKAFTEAAKLLADRRERMAAAETARLESSQSMADSLRVQSEAVTASLTTLVDQQRQQNMELLRLARLEHPPIQNGHAARVRSPRDVKSPRAVRRQRDARRSPRDRAQSPRDTSRSPRESTKSPRGSKSPRSRQLRSPKEMLERSDVSTGSSLQTNSTLGYSDDFGSAPSSNSESTSPRKSLPERFNSSINESLVTGDSMDSSVKTDVNSSIDTLKDSQQTDKDMSPLRQTSKESRSTVKTESLTSKGRYSLSPEFTSTVSTASADTPLHKVVLGAVKEVFKDGSPAELQSDPAFYDRLKSVLYTLKEGGVTPAALSTPSKHSPQSSPHKPPMVAPLSPRLDKRLAVRRPPGQRSSKKSAFSGDSESDESHSLLADKAKAASDGHKQRRETASDTDQECQLSALQHQLDEAKRRHAMMKKARQKYEFQKKQDAYKKQIEYYEEDMVRMKKEMDDLAAMHSATGSSPASHTTPPTRPQIKQPRAPSSSGSESGKQRHSSGASDADVTPQPSVIQKPLVGKTIGQLGPARAPYDRQRSDSGRSVDSELDSRQREKSPEYAEDFDSDFSAKMSKDLSRPASSRLSLEPVVPASKDTPRTEADYTYSNGFEDGARLRSTDSISESIADSIIESLQSKRDSVGSLSNSSDLLHLDHSLTAGVDLPSPHVDELEEPSLLNLLPTGAEPTKTSGGVSSPQPKLEETPRSRSHSASSSHTITEALVVSAAPSWSGSDRSRSASPAQSARRSRSRSISSRSASRSSSRSRSPSDRSRSFSDRSRSRSFSERSRTISERSRSRSFSERSRTVSERSRSRSPEDWSKSTGRRSRSPSRCSSVSEDVPSEVESIAASVHTGGEKLGEVPLLDLDIASEPAAAKEPKVDEQDSVFSGQQVATEPSPEPYASDFNASGTDNPSSTSSRPSDAGGDKSDAEESIVDDLVQSAFEEAELVSQQEPLLSLKEELEAALDAADLSTPRGDEVASRVTELDAGERLAESTPRLNDSETEAREQRDFEELEKMVTENASTETSADSSRISFGSDSSDFTNFSGRPLERKDDSSRDVEAGKEKSDEESELEKAISSAAAAVESFANELELTGSQADVGLSVIEETTPRSLLSSSLDDLLDDGHVTPTPAPVDSASSGETTPRVASPEGREADLSEKSIMQADDNQLNAAATDMIGKSMDIVIDLWRTQREAFKSEPKLSLSTDAPPILSLTMTTSQLATPTSPLATPISPLATPTSPLATPTSPLATPTSPLATPTSPLVTPTASPTKSPLTSPLKLASEDIASTTKDLVTGDSDEDKENQSAQDKSSPPSLLGTLPPLIVKSPKTVQPSVKSPESHSSSSSEESVSPQRSPTKLSFVEEARHEQWAQLDKDIDSAFGPNDGDWYDDDFGLGGDSKTSSAIPTKEILNRIVVPEPVFVVPHEESEVKGLADDALDIFWQARRCGETWDDLTPTPEFLDTGDKLELEASSTAAFKEFIFDLIKDMLTDIFQNEEGCEPTDRRLSRGPLTRYYRHRKPPNTLDEVREIIHRHIYPAVTGKLVHPSKTSKVLSVVRNKRRDKVDTILTQELREEEASWLDYTQDEQAVKDSLVEDVFKVLMEDSVSAVMHAYNRRHNIQPITEL